MRNTINKTTIETLGWSYIGRGGACGKWPRVDRTTCDFALESSNTKWYLHTASGGYPFMRIHKSEAEDNYEKIHTVFEGVIKTVEDLRILLKFLEIPTFISGEQKQTT